MKIIKLKNNSHKYIFYSIYIENNNQFKYLLFKLYL